MDSLFISTSAISSAVLTLPLLSFAKISLRNRLILFSLFRLQASLVPIFICFAYVPWQTDLTISIEEVKLCSCQLKFQHWWSIHLKMVRRADISDNRGMHLLFASLAINMLVCMAWTQRWLRRFSLINHAYDPPCRSGKLREFSY